MADCTCDETLLAESAALGVAVTVSGEPTPGSPYDDRGMRCPHGAVFFIQPTTEQIRRWYKAGVE